MLLLFRCKCICDKYIYNLILDLGISATSIRKSLYAIVEFYIQEFKCFYKLIIQVFAKCFCNFTLCACLSVSSTSLLKFLLSIDIKILVINNLKFTIWLVKVDLSKLWVHTNTRGTWLAKTNMGTRSVHVNI